MPLDLIVPAAIQDFDVLLMVEPWVYRPPSTPCRRVAFDGNPRDACALELLATREEAVTSAIRLAEAQLDTDLVGAYLQSFGATRMQGLLMPGGAVQPDWAVVQSPAPPRGTSALSLLRQRSDATVGTLTRGCATPACRTDRERVLDRWTRNGIGTEATGREIALGVIALSTLPSDNRQVLDEVGAALDSGQISRSLAGRLRRLGRTYELRGANEVNPSLVAIWADTCPWYTSWRKVADQREPLMRAFAWVFRGCSDGRAPLRGDARITMPMLVLNSTDDAVAPSELQQRWLDLATRAVEIEGRGHLWRDPQRAAQVARWVADQGPGEESP
ncbi:hypothetical protein KUV85_12495 [Nocardioides panacisoli]|uniref:alpha/beta fold hydrolase n=1 Tax=Nocardioides panacisoli TaxID=627624 RepID=UPI001C632A5A|nr:hypothetical protein [Nocardioides panacisoli]QYJ03151.1 hypothetical protein KUV85_12495 [Nocardioides panacisoli]